QMGLRTYTNDFLAFSDQIGKALIENKSIMLDDNDLGVLFAPNSDPDAFGLMESLFTDIFFTRDDARLVDSFRSNVDRLDDGYKRSMALAVMNRSLTRKVAMGHFAHTRAMAYAEDPARLKRNRSLGVPIKSLFMEILPGYNRAVFDNGHENRSYNRDAMEMLDDVGAVDVAYFDPPYCGSHPDYQGFYHLLETFTEYWKDKDFVNGTNRYEPRRFSGFDRKADVIDSFRSLFEAARNIPCWIVSYNDRSYPSRDQFMGLIREYRDADVKEMEYGNSRGGRGSVKGSRELLFICRYHRRFDLVP
ncbi:MAG: DNA methyltransferase, partial [Spirochaetia bacterium]|nr:DNA methyltransferase [Spirochaetia bacterium]